MVQPTQMQENPAYNVRNPNNINPYDYLIDLINKYCDINNELRDFLILNTKYFFNLILTKIIKYDGKNIKFSKKTSDKH